jgi:hypothetical protein
MDPIGKPAFRISRERDGAVQRPTGSSGKNISGSEPSPEEGDDEATVAWEMPVKQLAGIRDPGTKAFGTAILGLATWVTFQFDLSYKPAIMAGAIASNAAISAYGPLAGSFILRMLHQQIAERNLKKLEGLLSKFPNDPDIGAKVALGRAIIADGWLTRLQNAAKIGHSAPKTKANGKKK